VYRRWCGPSQRVVHADGTVGLSGHLYVEAFIPQRNGPVKKLSPILMLHSSISGTIFLQRANGDEGWALLFARVGYPDREVEALSMDRHGKMVRLDGW
jgi:hypothetical protein